MNDSLGARLAAMPAIEADLAPYAEMLRKNGWKNCCVQTVLERNGCDETCLHGSDGHTYYYHGHSFPTPETLIFSPLSEPSGRVTCACGRYFRADRKDPHSTKSADFDEETERVRLMPV